MTRPIMVECDDCEGEGEGSVEAIDHHRVHSRSIDPPWHIVECERCDGDGEHAEKCAHCDADLDEDDAWADEYGDTFCGPCAEKQPRETTPYTGRAA